MPERRLLMGPCGPWDCVEGTERWEVLCGLCCFEETETGEVIRGITLACEEMNSELALTLVVKC